MQIGIQYFLAKVKEKDIQIGRAIRNLWQSKNYNEILSSQWNEQFASLMLQWSLFARHKTNFCLVELSLQLQVIND